MSSLDPRNSDAVAVVRVVLNQLGEGAINTLRGYFSEAAESWYQGIRLSVLEMCVSQLGTAALPVLLTAIEKSEGELKTAAVERLLAMEPGADDKAAAEKLILAGLDEPRGQAAFVPAAGKLRTPACIERLWALLPLKGKTLRAAVSEALATADPGALDRAAGLQAEPSKDARMGGVLVLGKLADEPAIDCLLHRARNEKDADVRDTVMRCLRDAGVPFERIAQASGPLDFTLLRERAAAMKGPAVKWLAADELPELKLLDGSVLERDLVNYLLHRQSRQEEAMPDPEIAGLYRLIDRQSSGDFAHKLFNAFLENGPAKADAWAMLVAALLGDNRVMAALASKIRSWADDGEQKLGTFGVAALALNGSVPALAAVYAIAEKFAGSTRRKLAVIGEAAQESMEKAASRLKLSMDALGDTLVPTLGFEPGRPRLIEAGKRRIEAAIGLDFKLAMKDLETGKKVASIPKSAPPEVQAEFKGLGKLLLEVAKSQSARLERLMVNQHRWQTARWRELFQQQPVLFPFSVRLAWGAFDEQGRLTGLFRALPDRSLTDAGDEPFELTAPKVGIMHPLEMTPEQREAWRSHLGDYEIQQPFAQIDRQAVTVPDDLRERTEFDGIKGATLNGFGFRGRAEKSGWTRGSTGDGGMINTYRKRFEGHAIDAYVCVSGLPAYPDPTAMASVEWVAFVPLGADVFQSQGQRMKLGDVPAMVYCESVGDMMRIFGRL